VVWASCCWRFADHAVAGSGSSLGVIQLQLCSDSRKVPVPGPKPGVRGEPGRGEKLGIHIADTRSVQAFLVDQPEHLVIFGHHRLGETAQQRDDLVTVAQVQQRQLSSHPGMRQHRVALEQTDQSGVSPAEVVDPNRGVDQYLRGRGRRRGTWARDGWVPPSRASRRALSRSIRAASASRTTAVFPVLPVRRCASARMSSSKARVVRTAVPQ
jgi:hypothetical protein